MQYHKPDSRWKIFNIPDYETYLEQSVIKGLFHKSVPNDVVEAYEVAEYLMAHAYYHYPLYDEATSKVLRTIEMAVKLRCTEIRISLEYTIQKNNKPVTRKKDLNRLMNELNAAEPGKKMDWQFKNARNLRNSFMHPGYHTYSGAISRRFIERSVTLFNKLFLPGSVFTSFETKLTGEQTAMLDCKGLLVLEIQDKRYLVESVTVKAAIFINTKWVYYLAAIPVVHNIGGQMKDHSYSLPLGYFITDLSIEKNEISATEIEKSVPLSIQTTTHRDDLSVYTKFLGEKNNAPKVDQEIYDHFVKNWIAGKANEFWYRFLHQVDTSTALF